jgi:cell wall-associated NlpC family hydrolase
MTATTTKTFDPRVTPARRDLAAAHLKDAVKAERYAQGETREVVEPIIAIYGEPSHGAALTTQALKGERVTIYETTFEGWAWGQLETDGYVGWMSDHALSKPGAPLAAATHRVGALRTFVFPGPSIKLAPVETLSSGARLHIVRSNAEFAVTASNGHIPATHLRAAGSVEADYVAVAARFMGTPYLWGGKTSLGIDCSGLVQVALQACGIPCPRDSDMQERELGTAVAHNEAARGDLIFWKGHVGIVCGDGFLLHANAYQMAVASEPLDTAIARIAAIGSPVTSVRRL